MAQHSPLPARFFKKLPVSSTQKDDRTCQGDVPVAGVQHFEQHSDLLLILVPLVLVVLQAQHP